MLNIVCIAMLYSSLLTWGAGKFGQLGNTRREDSVQLQNIKHLVPEVSGEPTQVSAGCGHSGFVTLEGHAYTCGDNRYNQLGMVMPTCCEGVGGGGSFWSYFLFVSFLD